MFAASNMHAHLFEALTKLGELSIGRCQQNTSFSSPMTLDCTFSRGTQRGSLAESLNVPGNTGLVCQQLGKILILLERLMFLSALLFECVLHRTPRLESNQD